MRASLVDGLTSLIYAAVVSVCILRNFETLVPAVLLTFVPAKAKNSSGAPETMLSVFAAATELMLSYDAPMLNNASAVDFATLDVFSGKLPTIEEEMPSTIFSSGDFSVSTTNFAALPRSIPILASLFFLYIYLWHIKVSSDP